MYQNIYQDHFDNLAHSSLRGQTVSVPQVYPQCLLRPSAAECTVTGDGNPTAVLWAFCLLVHTVPVKCLDTSTHRMVYLDYSLHFRIILKISKL